MTPESNAGPTVAAGNLSASLRGIYTALGWAFFVACALCYSYFNSAAVQHDRANTHASQPAWLPISLVSFLVLPIVVCCFLLSTRRGNLVAAGAGVACGYFGALVIGSPFALLMMLLLLGLSASDRGFDHGLVVAWLGSLRQVSMCSSVLSS